MLKQMIQWEGFDGRPASQTLYFNLTRYEIAHDMELETLEARFKRFQEDVIEDANRDMSPPEIREMLDMVKTIIQHAYGVRSEDGKEFSKSPEIWRKFMDTGAFDAFIWYLFEEPARANNFMNGIWPKELQEAAAKVRDERPDIRLVGDDRVGTLQDDLTIAPDDDVPTIEGTDASVGWNFMDSVKDYSLGYLVDCSENEFKAIVEHFSDGRNIPFELLVAGGKRMSQGGETENP